MVGLECGLVEPVLWYRRLLEWIRAEEEVQEEEEGTVLEDTAPSIK